MSYNYNNHSESNTRQYGNNFTNQGFQSNQQTSYQPNISEIANRNSFNQHSIEYIPPTPNVNQNNTPYFNAYHPLHENTRSPQHSCSGVNDYPQSSFCGPRPRFLQPVGQRWNVNERHIRNNFPPDFNPGPLNQNFHHSETVSRNTTQIRHEEVQRPTNEIDIESHNTGITFQQEIYGTSKENDENWILGWVKKVEDRIATNEEKNIDTFKISDIQKKLLKYATTIKDLELVSNDMTAAFNESNTQEWSILKKKSEMLKDQLEALKKFFSEPDSIEKMKEVFSKRREKRKGWRKNKAKRNERKRKLKEENIANEKKINFILQQLYEEEKSKVNEQKMKKEVDSILKEVRTKQEEAIKMQKLICALCNLREVRMKKGETHGYIESSKANVFFSKLKGELDKLIEDQLNLYAAEEQTLKIMMEESKPTTHSVHSKPRIRSVNVDKIQNEIYEVLFGKKLSSEAQTDYGKSFVAAEESLEMLVNRRKAWDQFLVEEDDATGSAIPIGWVIPNSEPNEDWKPYKV